MTTRNSKTVFVVPSIPKGFENELMNVMKKGRGGILTKPLVIETSDGVCSIVKITTTSWLGLATLVAHVEVVPPVETLRGITAARLELDLRERQRNAELSLIKVR